MAAVSMGASRCATQVTQKVGGILMETVIFLSANIAGAIFLTLADGAVITSITPNHGLNNQVYGSLAGGTLITLKVKKRVLTK